MENLEIKMIKNKWRREQLKSELALAQLKADNARTDSYMCKITGVLGAVGKVKKHKQTSGRMFLKMRHSRSEPFSKKRTEKA